MSAYSTLPQAPATNSEITALVERLAADYGRAFIPANAHWTNPMYATGRALAVALGLPQDKADALRAHELTAYYSVARKSPEAAKRMALKQSPQAPASPLPALPATPLPEADLSALEAAIAARMAALAGEALTTARNDTKSALESYAGALPGIIAEQLAMLAPRKLQITVADKPPVTIETAHSLLPRVLRYCSQRIWPYLVGPAGSGKTTLAEQVAEAMGLPFYMAAKVQSSFELMGYEKPHNGKMQRTPFREAYEHGGVFLLDEMDASSAAALTAFNAALANGHCPFPDGLVKRHPDFIAIGAGNTYGAGKDRVYVGRNPIDGATLDRFAFLPVDYDEQLERAISPNQDWTKYVQAVRAEAMARGLRVIVSPRASIAGSKMLAVGDTWEETAAAFLWDKMPVEEAKQLQAAVPMSRFETAII